MNEILHEFKTLLKDGFVNIKNKYLDVQFKMFSFSALTEGRLNILDNYQTEVITIDEYIESIYKFQFGHDFFILCMSRKCFIFFKSEISHFIQFLEKNSDLKFIFITETSRNDLLNLIDTEHRNFLLKNTLKKENRFFNDELQSFQKNFQLKYQSNEHYINATNFVKVICRSIAGFLITKSHLDSKFDRFQDYNRFFINNSTEEYVTLRNIHTGTFSSINLVYLIEKERLLVLKSFHDQKEGPKLFERETLNYQKVKHPFIPMFYGTTEVDSKKSLIIEYIEGDSMLNIKEKCSDEIKIKIVFKILIILDFIHYYGFIYRDLKPNNFIVDEDYSVFLIDFDEMISKESLSESDDYTSDFSSGYVAPEITGGYPFTNKADIYSIGKIIQFLFSETFFEKNQKLKEICENCTSNNENKRPQTSILLDSFYSIYHDVISEVSEVDTISSIKDIHTEDYFTYWAFLSDDQNAFYLFNLGKMYETGQKVKRDITKAIKYYTLSANKNYREAQFKLGTFYYVGDCIKQDIKETIKYFTLASEQDHLDAQYNLGLIYFNGKYIEPNIKKAIEYFTLAAQKDHSYANYKLGLIYYKEKYLNQDINKAIYHFYLAANNHKLPKAQYYLGEIYYQNKYVERDIIKSIDYLLDAAYKNNVKAQLLLGQIFFENKYIERDMNRSTEFLTMAAQQDNETAQFILGSMFYAGQYVSQSIILAITYFKQASEHNNVFALFNLGTIYIDNKYIKRNVNESIKYYKQAADLNYSEAQNELGCIYYEGKYIKQDINKAIEYYNLAANQNHAIAQFNLGIIYLNGKHVHRDMAKSINYFTLSAKQNYLLAQYYLGHIYYDNEYIKCDINKAIEYFNLAAKQNDIKSHYFLGLIYYDNKYIQRDMDKCIYHLNQAAINGHLNAQYKLVDIFYNGLYVPRDISRSILYLTLASDQNCSEAQNFLGTIYFDGEYIQQNIEKAIYYFKLASDQDNANAQYNLGLLYYLQKDIKNAIHYFLLSSKQHPYSQNFLGVLYYDNKYIPRDINKSIYYFTMSANGNYPRAQHNLGPIYYQDKYIPRNIKKSLNYFNLAEKNNFHDSALKLGEIYYEGKYVEKDIEKAIHYFKEASSFNNEYAKNNLGIIYKNGFENKVNKNLSLAKEYFEEAIRQKNDPLSMFNLANIYLDENKNDKAVDLLIKSINKGFVPPIVILYYLLSKNCDVVDVVSIENQLCKFNDDWKSFAPKLIDLYNENWKRFINDNHKLELVYNYLRSADFLYIDRLSVPLEKLENDSKISSLKTRKKVPEINNAFYEGFGIEIN